MMILAQAIIRSRGDNAGNGYIAGSGDGIVTINAQPVRRRIWLLDVETMRFIAATWSLENGHYLFNAINAEKEYIVIARDYARNYEPVAYDYVKPAADLTVQEQSELWQSWQ